MWWLGQRPNPRPGGPRWIPSVVRGWVTLVSPAIRCKAMRAAVPASRETALAAGVGINVKLFSSKSLWLQSAAHSVVDPVCHDHVGEHVRCGAAVGSERSTEVKQMPYESGMDPVHDARRRFDFRFTLCNCLPGVRCGTAVPLSLGAWPTSPAGAGARDRQRGGAAWESGAGVRRGHGLLSHCWPWLRLRVATRVFRWR